jgi:polyribonucleotide nucleotidyltransferase
MALAAAILAAPVVAGEADAGSRAAVQQLQHDARALRDDVRRSSVDFGHQVAQRVHRARYEFATSMHQASVSMRHWWSQTRDSLSRI